jgi:small-conductance mechanosensitive channel
MAAVNETGIVDKIYTGIVSEIVVALIIILVGLIIGRIVGKLLEKILHDVSLDNFTKKTLKIKFSFEEFISSSAMYIIYLISIVTALQRFGFVVSALNIIGVAILLFVLVSFFLSVRDFVPNALAGLEIYRKKKLHAGDYVKIKHVEGKIIKIKLAETILETKGHDLIYVPNLAITKNDVIKK